MRAHRWFQKEATRKPQSLREYRVSHLAAKLRPHELIALLTRHYNRARLQSLPKVETTLNVVDPSGRQAVTISFGKA